MHAVVAAPRLVRAEAAALATSISVSPMMALSGVRSSWLMLARNWDLCWLAIFELPALVLDFVEQPHILDGNHRLIGERGDQLDLLVGERSHRAGDQTMTPIGYAVAQQRHAENRAKATMLLASFSLYSGSSRTSATWTVFTFDC